MAPKSTPPSTIVNITNLPELSGDEIVIADNSNQVLGISSCYAPSYSDPFAKTNKEMLVITIENIELRKRMAKIEKAMEIMIRGSGK